MVRKAARLYLCFEAQETEAQKSQVNCKSERGTEPQPDLIPKMPEAGESAAEGLHS